MRSTHAALFIIAFIATRVASQSPDESQPEVAGPAYLVTAPKIFTSLSESVCLVLFESVDLTDRVANITVKPFLGNQTLFESLTPLTSASQCFDVSMANIRVERALLWLSVPGLVDEVREIGVRPAIGLTVIETSKRLYRPQEEIQFRVMTFDQWLKPVGKLFKIIWVENSLGLPVMQWNNMSSDAGVLALTLPVAESNIYGTWKVKAITGNGNVVEKGFQVDDFLAPKVTIEVNGPEYILESDNSSRRSVCVESDLGFPLKGKVKIVTGYQRLDWNQPLIQSDLPFSTFAGDIEGCRSFTLNATSLRWKDPALALRGLTLNVAFTDNETSLVQERSLDMPVALFPLFIHFPSDKLMKSYFKHNLPYFGHLLVEWPDMSPASGEKVAVCYEVRHKPWVPQESPVCRELISDDKGVVYFDLPPFDPKVKQVLIKAYPVGPLSAPIVYLLQPWYSKATSELTIKPIAGLYQCTRPITFDVFVSNVTQAGNPTVYYQIIGRGLVEAPKQVALDLSPWSVDETNLVGKAEGQLLSHLKTGRMTVTLPLRTAFLMPLSRIIVYFLDAEKNLVTDSSAFRVDCLERGLTVNMATAGPDGAIDVQVNPPEGSVCALEVSTSVSRYLVTKRRVMKMLEKLDASHELLLKDKCEYQRLTNRRVRTMGKLAYPTLYTPRELVSAHLPVVIDYSDSWDAFNEVGLIVSSNLHLDNSPCEWDEYPNGVPADVLQGLNREGQLASNRVSQDEVNSIVLSKMEYEESLPEDLLLWDTLTKTPDTPISKQIVASSKFTRKEIYATAICFTGQSGISMAKTDLAPTPESLEVTVESHLPPRAVLGEVVTLKVLIKKTVPNCVPILVAPDASAAYEIRLLGDDATCLCNDTQVVTYQVRPKVARKSTIKLSVKSPESHSCPNAVGTPFAPKLMSNEITVYFTGVTTNEIKTQLICNEEGPKVHSLDQLQGTKRMTISTELLGPLRQQIKQSLTSERSALNVLSALAPLGYMMKLYENQLNSKLKEQMVIEVSKAYQVLMNYRLADGSYFLFEGRMALGDILLTASIFKVLSQMKPQTPYISDLELRKTQLFLYSRQSPDGCFYLPAAQRSPLHLNSPLAVTAYVVTSLLDAGQPSAHIPIVKAFNCILGWDEKVMAADASNSDVTNAMLSYMEVLRGDLVKAKTYLDRINGKAIETENSKHWETEMAKETAAYALLTSEALSESQDVKKNTAWLLTQNEIWKSPICSYALIKVWPSFRPQTLLRVKLPSSAAPIALKGFEPRALPPKVSRIQVDGNGCAVIQMEKPRVSTATHLTTFNVTVNGLENGFGSCRKRLMQLCFQRLNSSSQIDSPVVKLQIVSGYEVDEQFMLNSLLQPTGNRLNHFRVNDRHLYLYFKPSTVLRPGQPDLGPQCVPIPMRQVQVVENSKPGFIQLYDYHDGSVEVNPSVDTTSYSIPKSCQVVKEESKRAVVPKPNALRQEPVTIGQQQ